ncbi:hypothetical protein BUE93_20195 [Chromobacterium amazonense]|uniref:Uncharacterized protein n=1 Tax=Chromobacterium amazonense TaxID=1382803 RepID=A0A2S9WZ84_9NEIS|nr:hypothetical protein [Chromobacterium amazonense]PRP68773.1 hypothetical protein BUE93_20195 [Chromobacterium amazonense]
MEHTSPFACLIRSPWRGIAVHNVKLMDVTTYTDDDRVLLHVEYQGQRHELPHAPAFLGTLAGQLPAGGLVGYVQGGSLGIVFHQYQAQTLRRVPEMDLPIDSRDPDGSLVDIVGWACAARPEGFHAPVGLIPGMDGQFERDQTIAISVRVPPEFLQECKRYQLAPEALLRSFIGDVSGIRNWSKCPRADGYSSNGSDERDMAEAWLERAHGMDSIDLATLEHQESQAEERRAEREEFSFLMDEYLDNGGKAEDLHAMVQAIVDQQSHHA